MPRKKIEIVDIDLSVFPNHPEKTTLQAAQQSVVDYLSEGAGCDCPLCGRIVKAYNRKLSPVIVARLIVLVGRYLNSKDWEPVPRKPEGKNVHFANLEYWNFITISTEDETLVKPTRDGYNFIRGKTSVPSHIFFFNGKKIGVSASKVNVQEALEGKYDYSELMDGVPISRKKIRQ